MSVQGTRAREEYVSYRIAQRPSAYFINRTFVSEHSKHCFQSILLGLIEVYP